MSSGELGLGGLIAYENTLSKLQWAFYSKGEPEEEQATAIEKDSTWCESRFPGFKEDRVS